ncbi:hypothetical protein FHS21_004625 [Phyllobacterium trifolii]|uniref:Uncharacterized protein n=1 Tax=Phyllobacterium trifolii TaxID=300193 RepID=A0A839UHB8_9HYPH|nr:hypothetical protein [Phyllobacterium trifolii]
MTSATPRIEAISGFTSLIDILFGSSTKTGDGGSDLSGKNASRNALYWAI